MNHHTQLNIFFFHDLGKKKKNKREGRTILLGLTSLVDDSIILCATSNTAHESAEFWGCVQWLHLWALESGVKV